MHELKCGCKIKIDEDGDPQIDFEDLNLDCPLAWNLYHNGHTQSVFQLEKYLGKEWSRRCKPNNIVDAAALIAAIRPGTLNSKDENGRSLTELYSLVKNGKCDIEVNENIKPITADSHNIILFQEQIMKVCTELCGFTGAESNKMRKGIGKKDADLLNSLENKFMEGAAEVGLLTKEEAADIFEQIKSSARYSFNKCTYGEEEILYFEDLFSNESSIKISELYNNKKDSKNFGYSYSISEYGTVLKNRIIGIYPQGKRQIFEIKTEGGKCVKTTLNHKFPTDRGELPVGKIKLGDRLRVLSNDNLIYFHEKVVSILPAGFKETYDIEMAAPNHTFVMANKIVTCNSHSVGYAITGYWTAWVKSHFPLHYVCAWLRFSKAEQKPLEEISKLVVEAKRLHIDIWGPSIKNLPQTDFFIRDGGVYFGINSIKGCGTTAVSKLPESLEDLSWQEFLILHGDKIPQNKMINMIRVGAFDFMGEDRSKIEFEYELVKQLTKTEHKKIKEYFNEDSTLSLLDLLTKLVENCSKNRVEIVEDLISTIHYPMRSLKDSKENIIAHEKELLGISLSFSNLETVAMPDFVNKSTEIPGIAKKEDVIVAGQICGFRQIKTKTGLDMAFFEIEDDEGTASAVIFSETLHRYQASLYDSNIVLAKGVRSDRGTGFIVNQIFSI